MLSLRYSAAAAVLPNATVIVSGGYGINPDYSSVYHDTTEMDMCGENELIYPLVCTTTVW